MTDFIHSDAGQYIAYALIILGIADLFSVVFVTKINPELAKQIPEKMQKFMTALYFAATFMLLVGLYMLYIRNS